VFENRVLKGTFGSKRKETKRDWRRLYSEGLYNLYSLPNIRMIKSRSVGWAWHVVCMGEIGNKYKIFVRKFKGGDHLEDLSIDGIVILK
jgi:hypothetical protein